MTIVNLKMNDQQISAPSGVTVLEAARLAGVDIPTLCDHPALTPIGSCRMCLVEIKGQRALQPACTFPISEGMEIQTESPKVKEARRFVLELLFSERNHYCMYCEMTGDCELQSLGYRYGIDHWVYPTYTKRFPVDASRQYFIMDHNRCILCRRCIRACSELVANHTLGMRQRGADSMIHADMDVPFGESSCVSCGTCLQVCPTGALVDKRSAFMGRDIETEHIKSVCSQCSLGCGTEVVVRAGNVLRIEGDWDAPLNAGVLCQAGRFDPLYEDRKRITSPIVRKKGKAAQTQWDVALEAAAKRIVGAASAELGLLTSSNATNEALYLLAELFGRELKATNMGMLNDVAPRVMENSKGSLADVANSDVILVVGADPAKDQPVAAFLVKRALDKGGRLVVVDDGDSGLAALASLNLELSDIDEAMEIAKRADSPAVVYGTGVTKKAARALKELKDRATFVALQPGVNTQAAAAFGFEDGFEPSAAEILYLLVGEQDWDGKGILEGVRKGAFLIVQACYESALTARADVVLPMAIWSERTGSLTDTTGRVQKANQAVEPKGQAKADWEILSLLANTMGKKLGASLDEISARAAKQLK